MAFLGDDLSFKVTWPAGVEAESQKGGAGTDDALGDALATVAYTVHANPEERSKYVMDWRTSVRMLLRVGDFYYPALNVNPRPSDADRILASFGKETFRVDKQSPPTIPMTHEYRFPKAVEATLAPADWQRLYVRVYIYPYSLDDSAFADIEYDQWVISQLPPRDLTAQAQVGPPDPERIAAEGRAGWVVPPEQPDWAERSALQRPGAVAALIGALERQSKEMQLLLEELQRMR